MSTARLLVGDVFEQIETLDDGSVDLALTSPPFWTVRDYLPADHPLKQFEIGQERSPGEYLQTLLRLVGAIDRKLAWYGSLAVELGDTYAGSGGAGGDYNQGGFREGQGKWSGSAAKRRRLGIGADYRPARTPADKSLCGIPTLFAWSLVYGRNLLTGEPSPAGQIGRWIVRNVVVWARPNPAVGELFDKFRPSTSFLTVATRARDRYFDVDAVRLKSKTTGDRSMIGRVDARERARAAVGLSSGNGYTGQNPGGTPPNDYWQPWPMERALWDWWEDEIWRLSPQPYKGAHYAVWPPMLCQRPIETMCPRRVCRSCGIPSKRIIDREGETIGWSDCGHDDWRPGMVLDPFIGSGTTAAVATGLGRDCVGIDIDERNALLCRERIGMFLTEIVEPLRDVRPTHEDDGIEDVQGVML